MAISCDTRCGFIRTLANLRCRDCFRVEVNSEAKDGCDCRITVNPDRVWGWE